MTPQCFCKSHSLEGRQLHDLHEIDPEQNETALQVYIASYRSLNADEAMDKHDRKFALLRKATRLDLAIPSSTPAPLVKTCAQCEVDVSPRWYTAKHDSLVCHQCWFAQ